MHSIMSSTIRSALRAALATALLAVAPATAAAGDGLLYQLGDSPSYQEGCFPPCLCPLSIYPLGGTFELRPVDITFPQRVYAVEDVQWVIGLGDEVLPVTGSGTYVIQGDFIETHQLQLDLSIDGGAVMNFDSGVVFPPPSFPLIDMTLSLNGMVCFDQVFDVLAFPAELGTNYCDNLPNSTGLPADIAATGSPFVPDNDFTLHADQLPAGSNGLFFFGANPTALPFGDGVLCVQPPLKRLPPLTNSGLAGSVSRPVDFFDPSLAGLLEPGTCWNFQYWFRDVAGGPAGFNTSDGFLATFL